MSVAIFTAVYNGNRHVRDFFFSLEKQVYRDFTLYIIDDCSEDGTSSLIAEYCNQVTFDVKFLHNEQNLGLTKSLIKLATIVGSEDFIARLDIDDRWDSSKLITQVDFLNKNQHYALVCCGMKCINDGLNLGGVNRHLIWGNNKEIHIDDFYSINRVVHSSILMRREVYFDIGGYNSNYRYAQDYELWVKMLMLGHRIFYLNEILVHQVYDKNRIGIISNRAQRIHMLKIKIKLLLNSQINYLILFGIMRDLVSIMKSSLMKK